MNRLDEIEARAKAATEGPWRCDYREKTVDLMGALRDALRQREER